MAQGEKMVTIRNLSGRIQTVRSTHPILRNPDVEVVPAGADPDDADAVLEYEDWAPEELLRYAEEHGIDVGAATSARTLAARIRAAEGDGDDA